MCWPVTRPWPAGPTELVASLPDLDVSHPLPEAPWFPPGERWSARRVLLHIMAETAHHAGARRHHPRIPGRGQVHGLTRGAGLEGGRRAGRDLPAAAGRGRAAAGGRSAACPRCRRRDGPGHVAVRRRGGRAVDSHPGRADPRGGPRGPPGTPRPHRGRSRCRDQGPVAAAAELGPQAGHAAPRQLHTARPPAAVWPRRPGAVGHAHRPGARGGQRPRALGPALHVIGADRDRGPDHCRHAHALASGRVEPGAGGHRSLARITCRTASSGRWTTRGPATGSGSWAVRAGRLPGKGSSSCHPRLQAAPGG